MRVNERDWDWAKRSLTLVTETLLPMNEYDKRRMKESWEERVGRG